MDKKVWDIIVVGGGLAGLSLAILSAKSNLTVLVIEKGHYPRHKVCGEYISMESFDFLMELGLPLAKLNLPQINNFLLTSHHGFSASCVLDTTGFGMSRYLLDGLLAKIATENSVEVSLGQKITDIRYCQNLYQVQSHSGEIENARLVVGAYGRISGLKDLKDKSNQKYFAVKYHLNDGPAADTIEIHNFKGGYCGISKIEDGKYNLCYLAKATELKLYKGDLEAFENAVLKQNSFLKKRLEAKQLTDSFKTAHIQFGINDLVGKEYLQIGDAAGFIPPITGNGMSLAFRSAKVLHGQVMEYFSLNKSRKELLSENHKYSSNYLAYRINKGIIMQKLLFINNKIFNKLLMKSLALIPGLMKLITKQAVGRSI
ncbi:MAG: NAD(P)/FAD-dependent oxidoreductase [Bacteroidetes bacterium]|nr:NAD(P)/FAD-dependent oxidoreductase [Bacteroidota bacterium]